MGARCQRIQDSGGAGDEAHHLENFTSLEGCPLHDALKSGSIRLARGDYFLRAFEEKRPLQKRQDLTDNDLWPPEEAAKMWVRYGNLFLLVVSYAWLAQGHPDPEMWHLKRFARIVREWMAYLQAVSQGKVHQMDVAFKLKFKWRGYPLLRNDMPSDVGVFVDYLSLYQEPRTPEQQTAFDHGLGQINALYAHTFTSTLVCSAVPDDEPRKYDCRGWTLFEVCVTSAKPMAFMKAFFFGASFDPDEDSSAGPDFIQKHLSGRRPPCSQARFEELMESRRRAVAELPPPHNRLFTNNRDQPRLYRKYEEIWEDLRGVRDLQFVLCGWRAADVRALAGVLPNFPGLRALNLNSNLLGDDGAEALSESLPRGLEHLQVWQNGISAAGASKLLSALPEGLIYLNLSGNPVCSDRAAVTRLRQDWCASGRAGKNLVMGLRAGG